MMTMENMHSQDSIIGQQNKGYKLTAPLDWEPHTKHFTEEGWLVQLRQKSNHTNLLTYSLKTKTYLFCWQNDDCTDVLLEYYL